MRSANMSKTSGKLNYCEPSKTEGSFFIDKITYPLDFSGVKYENITGE